MDGERNGQRDGEQSSSPPRARLLHVVRDVQPFDDRTHAGGGEPQRCQQTKRQFAAAAFLTDFVNGRIDEIGG
jgi:hypothetical protein